MNRLLYIFVAFLAYGGIASADTAAYNPQDNSLSLSSVKVTNAGSYQLVILGLNSLGTVTTDDPRVGNIIEFDPSSNTLFLPSVTVNSTSYSKVSLSGLSFDVLSVNGTSTDIASFNSLDNTLSLSAVRIPNAGKFNNVVLRLTSFGTIATNDPRVGYSIAYDPTSNTLFLPSVTANNTTYSKVSFSGLTFDLVSVDGVSVNTGSSGSYSLDLIITTSGVTTPAVHIDNVPKPNNQGEFCSDAVYQQFQQSVQGFSGTWQITSCSFDGTTGFINALLTVTSPITISVPYSVQYSYVAH